MKELRFHNKHFEAAVRDELLIFDRPITADDALLAYDLDCSYFVFDFEDCDTLCAFKKLEWLHINVDFEDLSFLQGLVNLEELRVEFFNDNYFDLSYLIPLQKLNALAVCGGYGETIFDFRNFDALVKLPCLQSLTLHEFGAVDLSALKHMPNLTGFQCSYANKVYNVEAISNLVNLIDLVLVDITVPNLDFMKTLPDEMMLTLSGVNCLEKVDLTELHRFKEYDISDIEVNGERINI